MSNLERQSANSVRPLMPPSSALACEIADTCDGSVSDGVAGMTRRCRGCQQDEDVMEVERQQVGQAVAEATTRYQVDALIGMTVADA